MKREKLFSGLISFLLGTLLAFGAVMSMESAFSLTAVAGQVLLGCAISGLLFSIGFSIKWWYIPLLLLAPVAGYLWFGGQLADSAEWVIYQISRCYDSAYGTGVFYRQQIPTAGDATLALCALGSVIAFVTAWSVCRKTPAILAVLAASLPLAACFVVTDRVPTGIYLGLFLFCACLLLLGGLTRRKDPAKGNRLMLLICGPVAVALLILFWAVPRDTYAGQYRADQLLQKVTQWAEKVDSSGGITGSGGLDQTVELGQTGRLVQTHTPTMTVEADGEGMLYLRKQGYQCYDGTSWYNEHANDISVWMRWEELERAGQVTVTTRNQYLMKFVPYYAKDAAVSSLGITENTEGAYTYVFDRYILPEDGPSAIFDGNTGGLQLPVGQPSPDAISLPAATVSWAEPLALELTADKTTVREKAEAIGSYVRTLADYSRNTGRMPAGEQDFARWFATEADTGYCVHFATTATVLLRAAGIQAQYVEGYALTVRAGQTATVYEDQAHAWVEYYDPAVGWRILESTPAEGLPGYIYVSPDESPTQSQQPEELPEQTMPPQNEPVREEKTVSPVLWWILGIVAAAAVIFGQWQLRLRLKKHRLTAGEPNRQAVQLWKELERTSKWLGQRPSRQWYELAQKARFSNHVLRVQELEILTEALREQQRQLRRKPWYMQPVYTIILAIY